jgi:hypothetical protein
MLLSSVAIGSPLLLNPRRGSLALPAAVPASEVCQSPDTYSFQLGEFDITNISDANAVIDGPHPIVGEDQKPELVASLMRDNLLPERRFQPGFTPTLLRTGKELILFDTGNGANGFVPRPYGG